MDNPKQAIAARGLLVAAMRAEESARDDALFTDPFAERLAGEDRATVGADCRSHEVLRRGAAASPGRRCGQITFSAPVRLVPFSTSPVINDLIERVDRARGKHD
jgi:hypothetical protein